eukprot:scaffold5360_cov118-Isochrysis_galbana.AAC.5
MCDVARRTHDVCRCRLLFSAIVHPWRWSPLTRAPLPRPPGRSTRPRQTCRRRSVHATQRRATCGELKPRAKCYGDACGVPPPCRR